MGLVLLLVALGLGFGLYTGRLKPAQLLPIALIVAGAVLALRGGWLLGVPAIGVGIAWYRGMTWRLFGLRTIQSSEYELAAARWLLGVSANDDVERIKAQHKDLLRNNDVSKGGGEERVRKLNEARDLLLNDLKRKKG